MVAVVAVAAVVSGLDYGCDGSCVRGFGVYDGFGSGNNASGLGDVYDCGVVSCLGGGIVGKCGCDCGGGSGGDVGSVGGRKYVACLIGLKTLSVVVSLFMISQ